MRKIILANGAEYDCQWCAAMDGKLDMNLVTDQTMPQLAAAFGDPANTARIILQYTTDLQDVFEGYTVLKVLSDGGWTDGTVLVILGKEQM